MTQTNLLLSSSSAGASSSLSGSSASSAAHKVWQQQQQPHKTKPPERSWVAKVLLQDTHTKACPSEYKRALTTDFSKRPFVVSRHGLYDVPDVVPSRTPPGSWVGAERYVVSRPLSAPSCHAVAKAVVGVTSPKVALLNVRCAPSLSASLSLKETQMQAQTQRLRSLAHRPRSAQEGASSGVSAPNNDVSLLTEKSIIDGINLLRTRPHEFASLMKQQSSFVSATNNKKLTLEQAGVLIAGHEEKATHIGEKLRAMRATHLAEVHAIIPAEEDNKKKKKTDKDHKERQEELQLIVAQLTTTHSAKEAALQEQLDVATHTASTLHSEVKTVLAAATRLNRLTPQPPLTYSVGISLAARDACSSSGDQINTHEYSIPARYGLAIGSQFRAVTLNPVGAFDVAQDIAGRGGETLAAVMSSDFHYIGCGWRRCSSGSIAVLYLCSEFQESSCLVGKQHLSLQMARYETERVVGPVTYTLTFLPLRGDSASQKSVTAVCPIKHPVQCEELQRVVLRLKKGIKIKASFGPRLAEFAEQLLIQPVASGLFQTSSEYDLVELLIRAAPPGHSAVHLHVQRGGDIGYTQIGKILLESPSELRAKRLPFVTPSFYEHNVVLKTPLQNPLRESIQEFCVEIGGAKGGGGGGGGGGDVCARLQYENDLLTTSFEQEAARETLVLQLSSLLSGLDIEQTVLACPLAEDFLVRIGARLSNPEGGGGAEADSPALIVKDKLLKEAEQMRERLAYTDMHLRVLQEELVCRGGGKGCGILDFFCCYRNRSVVRAAI